MHRQTSRSSFLAADTQIYHRRMLNPLVPMLLNLRLARVLARDTYLSQSKKAKLFEEQVRSQQ